MDPMTALDRSASCVAKLVGQSDESQWALPTPCTEWDVRELVGHLIAGGRAYADLLHGAPAAHLQSLLSEQATLGGDDPTGALAEAAAAVRAAFAEPGALERTARHPSGDVPGSRLLQMRINENVVHGWDLATALGAPAGIDDDLAEDVYQHLAPRAAHLSATGYFAAPTRTLPPDASPLERLMALVGR